MKTNQTNKIFGLVFCLAVFSGSVAAETQISSMFVPTDAAEKIYLAGYTGKPPYKNRYQVMAKSREERKTLLATSKNMEKTELSAMELNETNVESSTNKRKKRLYGHPYHRR